MPSSSLPSKTCHHSFNQLLYPNPKHSHPTQHHNDHLHCCLSIYSHNPCHPCGRPRRHAAAIHSSSDLHGRRHGRCHYHQARRHFPNANPSAMHYGPLPRGRRPRSLALGTANVPSRPARRDRPAWTVRQTWYLGSMTEDLHNSFIFGAKVIKASGKRSCEFPVPSNAATWRRDRTRDGKIEA
ncbi:hypothetical protein BCR44DRAFT_1053588 [Catenaria anguillulae PL171]|uniref:Uncharacterized protein n=1 Tax=Catenaria anguillulae PL171 TaxID=765915 RepID=A0A1Y2HTP2_9FUNG|nr:hypothetical protein BCR44DRAFT_1053588 [Catenaria anguillulae PL171]